MVGRKCCQWKGYSDTEGLINRLIGELSRVDPPPATWDTQANGGAGLGRNLTVQTLQTQQAEQTVTGPKRRHRSSSQAIDGMSSATVLRLGSLF